MLTCLSLMTAAPEAQGRLAHAGSPSPLSSELRPVRSAADVDLQALALTFEPVQMPNTFNPFPDGLINAMPANRPRALPFLYVSLAALQAFDGYSTITGTARGAREMNPLVGAISGNAPAIWMLKGGVALASIYAAEKQWKNHHRARAVAIMVISNGIMTGVALRNASVNAAP